MKPFSIRESRSHIGEAPSGKPRGYSRPVDGDIEGESRSLPPFITLMTLDQAKLGTACGSFR